MYISKNDGMLDLAYVHQRDLIIELNSATDLGRDSYTADELAAIKAALARRR